MYDTKGVKLAKSIDEAIKLLNECENPLIISGGTDVLISAREGKYRDNTLISIHGIKELKGVYLQSNGDISIQAASSFTSIVEDEIINSHIDFLGQAADLVGGPQVRNVGTIGGNICTAMPSADTATSLLVLEAIVNLEGASGRRSMRLNEFYTGPGKSVKKTDEILTHFTIEKDKYEGYKGFYIKYAMRNAMDISTLGCAALVKLSDDKSTIEDVKLGFAVAAPTPIRAKGLEEQLKGAKLDDIYEVIVNNILNDLSPRDSWRASKDFREHMLVEICSRSLEGAINKWR